MPSGGLDDSEQFRGADIEVVSAVGAQELVRRGSFPSSLLCRILGQTDAIVVRRLQFIPFCCPFSLFFRLRASLEMRQRAARLPLWEHSRLEIGAARVRCQKAAANSFQNPHHLHVSIFNHADAHWWRPLLNACSLFALTLF